MGVRIRVEGRVGRITLDRPHALNAFDYDGLMAIDAALRGWALDEAVALVLIDGAGERAFCAGGDIQEIHRRGRAGDFAYARQFWIDEYRLNALIARYPKPYVAIMDGVTMGGGVGLSAHGAHRIVTERSRVAMPEAAIGLIPDAGGLWLLARAPGRLGEHLAMTGARMGAADAIYAGFADRFIAGADREAAVAALVAAGSVGALAPYIAPPPDGVLAPRQEAIDRIYAADTALEARAALGAEDAEWAREAAAAIDRAAPLSVAAGFDAVRRARRLETLEAALALELRFTWRAIEEGDFLEGVRAMVIDKDKAPRWRPSRLEALASARVEAMLAPLADAQDPQDQATDLTIGRG